MSQLDTNTEVEWYFNGETFAFIPARWRYDGTYPVWPDGAVALTPEEVAEYRGASPAHGKTLGVSEDGRPIWVDYSGPATSYAMDLSALNASYAIDRQALATAYASAGLADAEYEEARKADLRDEHAELMAQYAQDLAELKTKHGVA